MRFSILLLIVFCSVLTSCKKDIVAQTEKSCNSGNLKSCLSAVDYHMNGYKDEDVEYPVNTVQAFRFLTKACDLNDGQSCFKVGVEFENSKYTQDRVAALEFYEKACKSKFIKGCTAAGMLYSQKKEIRTDLRASYGFFKK